MKELMNCSHPQKQMLTQQVRNKKTLREGGSLRRGDEWIRTIDTRIFSPMLYQLSYITVAMGCKTM